MTSDDPDVDDQIDASWDETDLDLASLPTGLPDHLEQADQPAELYYACLDRFVAEYLAPLYRREVDGHHHVWCPQWWRHAEAITRLEALWRSWEQLRLDPAVGISIWLRDHADVHMAVLLDVDGPFQYCRGLEHSARLKSLPIHAPPTGLFTPESGA